MYNLLEFYGLMALATFIYGVIEMGILTPPEVVDRARRMGQDEDRSPLYRASINTLVVVLVAAIGGLVWPIAMYSELRRLKG